MSRKKITAWDRVILARKPDRPKSLDYITDVFDEFIELYDRLCKKRGFLIRGGEIDYNRAGKTFVDDFRAGKFGRITLE